MAEMKNPPKAGPMIEFRGTGKSFGDLKVLQQVDLQVAQGGERETLLHHVEIGLVAPAVGRDGEADAIAGHAGTDLLTGQETCRECQGEAAQTGPVGDGHDGGDGLDDASEHGA